jgi:hypothetical protein
MLDYIRENCELPIMETEFDNDSQTWVMWFEERFPKWYKKDFNEQADLISLHFEDEQEFKETLTKLETIQQERKIEDEATQQNQEPVLA